MVAIGRNEGDRLDRCLRSLPLDLRQGVYVDSDSSDGSVALARSRGVEVVELDMTMPFNAARARNAGLKRLMEIVPEVEYVQFVDGDCEVVEGWLETAAALLDERPDVVAVCGRRRERFPDRSAYNCICDVEWRIFPAGEATSFGGDVIIRSSALAEVNGYNVSVIAAEDDELSIRLRRAGGKILRIEDKSTIHDADMHQLGQWWRRAQRCGHGYAQLFSLYGQPPENCFRRQLRSATLWGAAVPLITLGTALFVHPASLFLFAAYPLLAFRYYRSTRMQGYSRRESTYWSLSCVGGKFPQAIGIATYVSRRLLGVDYRIIEYK